MLPRVCVRRLFDAIAGAQLSRNNRHGAGVSEKAASNGQLDTSSYSITGMPPKDSVPGRGSSVAPLLEVKLDKLIVPIYAYTLTYPCTVVCISPLIHFIHSTI